jgi:serine protease Do
MKKTIILSLTLTAGLLIGLLIGIRLDVFSPAQSQPTQAAAISTNPVQMEDAIVNVANKAGKAVVSISTERTTHVKGGKRMFYFSPYGDESPLGNDDVFRRFFDDFFGEMPDRDYKQVGLGSGVIIDPSGYILTNQHVIDQADKIKVTLSDGREFKGEIKGQDARSDLAVIKIDAKDLPAAELGNSEKLRIGEWVVAIGNPFGFALEGAEPTVTVGVISALHRSLGKILSRNRDYTDLLQTDAAINPGNSGGPLVNLKGEVVGINVAIFSTSGGYQGIGFAIPINAAKRIISQLIEGKEVLYGWIGITIQDLTEDMAKYFGLSDKNGVLVAKVLKDSPAEKGGIKEKDIIVKIGPTAVKTSKELLNAVSRLEVGKKEDIVVIRDKQEVTLTVEIGKRPKNLDAYAEPTEQTETPQAWRGIEVTDLTAELAQRLHIEERQGVVVVTVTPESPADAAGLTPRDVILEINNDAVKNTADFERITQSIKGDALVRTLRGYFLIKAGDARED